MQEEVNEKTVSLCITGGKVTVRLLKQAMMRFLAAMEKEKAEKARKQQAKGPPDKDYRGKQSLKKLAQQNVQLSNIEITDNNIKAFEKVAKKYGIDFSLKRDKPVLSVYPGCGLRLPAVISYGQTVSSFYSVSFR